MASGTNIETDVLPTYHLTSSSSPSQDCATSASKTNGIIPHKSHIIDDRQCLVDFQEQLDDLTNQIRVLGCDDRIAEEDVWQIKDPTSPVAGSSSNFSSSTGAELKSTATLTRRPRSGRSLTVCISQIPAHHNGAGLMEGCSPRGSGNESFGRLSPHSSSSTASSNSKSDEILESGVLRGSEAKTFRGSPKTLACSSTSRQTTLQRNGPLSSSANVKNFVQSFEKLKDLSNRNSHSPSDLFPAHRSALAGNDVSSNRHASVSIHSSARERSDTLGSGAGGRAKGRDEKYFSLNGYRNEASTLSRRLPEFLRASHAQGNQSKFFVNPKPSSTSRDLDSAQVSPTASTQKDGGALLTRHRGVSEDRHSTAHAPLRNAESLPQGRSGYDGYNTVARHNDRDRDASNVQVNVARSHAPLTRWTMTKHGRDLQKTNSLDPNEQQLLLYGSVGAEECIGGRGTGGNGGSSRLVTFFSAGGGGLTRATSLSKFDDDDEYLMSPPTTSTPIINDSMSSTTSSTPIQRPSRFANPTVGYRPTFRPPALLLNGGSTGPTCPYGAANSPGSSCGNGGVAAAAAGCGEAINAFVGSAGVVCASTPSSCAKPLRGNHCTSVAAGAAEGGGGVYASPYATLRLSAGRKNNNTAFFPPEPFEESAISNQRALSDYTPSSPSYRLAEDIQANEIRRLRQDLQWAKEQVALLTSRLSNNANVVDAFDRSLCSMSQRLHQLTNTSQNKNVELTELLDTVESLRRQNRGQPQVIQSRQDSDVHLGCRVAPVSDLKKHDRISRQVSSDSVKSLTGSATSVCSTATTTDQSPFSRTNSVKNWLRSSFGKAFSRKKNPQKGSSDTVSAVSSHVAHANSMPSISYALPDTICDERNLYCGHRPLQESHHLTSKFYHGSQMSSSSTANILGCPSSFSTNPIISTLPPEELHRQSMHCPSTYIRPATATHKRSESLDQRFKHSTGSCLDVLMTDRINKDSHKIIVSVAMSPDSIFTNQSQEKAASVVIGSIPLCSRTSWDMLDALIRRIFQEHLIRLDPNTSLGLNGESVFSYNVGEVIRTKGSAAPELLPIGYLIGDVNKITINLKGNEEKSVDLLAFETLIPKSVLQRHLKLLLEHRRIILSGSTGTGKTYLAQRLAECLVARSGSEMTSDSIAIFRVDSQSSRELRQYLSNMKDQCERKADRLPVVVILDNLHHVSSLSDAFSGFLDTNYQNSPYIIGTMNQATCSTTDLQLHHNFRWVLYANHIEPVRTFLGRYLRRQLVPVEVISGAVNQDLTKVVEWLPKVWQHVNKFLETHSSCDITIGPRLFLSCPMDVSRAQVWFNDLWNYSVVPYLLEAVREGIQTYGCRAPWEDLADWVIESYPWTKQSHKPALLRVRPEDVGYENKSGPITQGDGATDSTQTTQQTAQTDKPSDAESSLMDMLARLQEAAVHSDSDTNSTDGHSQTDRHEGRLSDNTSLSDTTSGTSPPCRTTIL